MTTNHNEHWDRQSAIGRRIAYYRKQRKMTQNEFAKQLKVSRQHIGAVEALNVKRKVSLDLLFNISDLLGVEPKFFLDYQELPLQNIEEKSKK